ncbi:L-lactate transporter [Candidatus Entotheonellaceae bacterium PAL068K]
MHAHKPRLYYGWIVVAIGSITMMLIMGTFFSSGVLFAAITKEYGWSRATASLPFSLALVCYATTAWVAGWLFDRYGPRRLFPLGALCMGLGLIASAWVQRPWHLGLSWGLLVAQGFNLAGFAPHLALVALWFKRWRGMAAGLVISGASLGGLVVIPGVQYLVNQYGWRSAYTVTGLVVIVCLVPLNTWWQHHYPADLGLHPDGETAVPPAVSSQAAVASVAPLTLWQAMGTARFWLLFVIVGCMGWLGNITSVHQIAHMIGSGFPSLLAAFVVGLMGLLRAVSSIVWGSLSDRCGREIAFSIGTFGCLVGLACLVLLRQSTCIWLLYGYALAFGLGYGAYGTVYAASTADLFFGAHLGTILGALELGWGLGGFSGAWLGGYWYDRWGSYDGVFMLTSGVGLLGCLALWLAAPRSHERAASQPLPVSS